MTDRLLYEHVLFHPHKQILYSINVSSNVLIHNTDIAFEWNTIENETNSTILYKTTNEKIVSPEYSIESVTFNGMELFLRYLRNFN